MARMIKEMVVQDCPIRNVLALQIYTSKDLAQNAKHQGLLIKRKILGYEGKREAILSN